MATTAMSEERTGASYKGGGYAIGHSEVGLDFMDQNLETTHQSLTAPTAGPEPDVLEKIDESSPQSPYLKVFGPDIGVVEYELSDKTVTIGRDEQADIRLPDPSVSRAHATVTCSEGKYTLQDVGSKSGTKVNRKDIQNHVLSHGDSAQIGSYVLQYRTYSALPGAAAAAKRAKLLLHSQFSLLPSGIRLRFRTLAVGPQEIFASGDTLRIGQSGLLIPVSTPPGDCICVELQLSWFGKRSKRYLGDVVGVIEEESTHWMCVKLHTVSRDVYESTVNSGQPGEWIDVASA